MLIFLLFASITNILQKINPIKFDIHVMTFPNNLIYAIITAIIATILFYVLCLFLTNCKDLSEHFSNWDYDSLKIIRFLRVAVLEYMILKITNHVLEGYHFRALIFTSVVLVILDIICSISISIEYSKTIRETVLDSLLLEIRDLRTSILIWLAICLICKTTLLGALLFLSIAFAIYSFFDR